MTAVVAFVDPRDLTYADLGARLRVSGPGFSPEKFAGCTVLMRVIHEAGLRPAGPAENG